MNALNAIERIITTKLCSSDLRYCFVTTNKHPIRHDGKPARPNVEEDFVTFDELLLHVDPTLYAGVGISIQASNVCAIDVDHCFSIANDISSADERAKDVLARFGKVAYCEFSFSGKGLRVLFRNDIIEHYSDKYYIKNEKNGIEFYQPNKSFRYVTVTGNVIENNSLSIDCSEELTAFLEHYMQRPLKIFSEVKTAEIETRSFEDLMKLVKFTYFTNSSFQNAWFAKAPGSGKDESECDYYLLSFLFENITRDKELLRQIFEQSPYFKSKDSHHIYKWNNQEHRYYNYVYTSISRSKI